MVSKPRSLGNRLGLIASLALLGATWLCMSAAIASAHHVGGLPNGGRLPGQPDFKRIGKTTYRFLPAKEEYEIHTEGKPPSFAHVDPAPSAIAASIGAGVFLPAAELAPVCRPSGNRIIPVYTHRPGDPAPTPVGQIRSIVQRMNWKINQQSSLSSGGARPVQMAVDCSGSTINVYNVATANNNFSTISTAVESLFGKPSDANAVKYLVFEPELAQENPNIAGLGERRVDTTKSYTNQNARFSATAVLYEGAWEVHTTIHELMHTLGASQGDSASPPPFATVGGHCSDGIDILCYNDGSAGSGSYAETRCSAAAGYGSPEGVPIDCGNDTYFDTLPEKGSWLDTHWNSGGQENPYLVNLNEPLMTVESGSLGKAPDANEAIVTGFITSWGYVDASYQYEYGETTSYGLSAPSVSGPVKYGQASYPTLLPNLDPGKTYHYRLRATRNGVSVYGADSSFTTLSTSVTGVKSTEATLEAGINPQGLSTTYQFEYGPTTAYGTKVPAAPKSIGSGTSWVGVGEALAGLTPGTTYHYRLATTNEKGTTYSPDKTFKTYKVAPTFSSTFGSLGAGNGQMKAPGAVTATSGGPYISDTGNNRIQRFNFKGEYLGQFGSFGSGAGQLNAPLGVALRGASIYVADTGNSRIQKFFVGGGYSGQIGSAGSGLGQLDHPHDVAVDSAGNIWVADTGNNRVVKFDEAGAYQSKFASPPSEAGALSQPGGIAVDSAGNIWVADTGNNRIEKFSPLGQLLAQVGSKGTGPGQLEGPQGISIDSQGAIWVADTGNRRIQEFNARGEFLAQFGSKGSGPGQFEAVADVAADTDGEVWVADSTANRISKWGPLAVLAKAATDLENSSATLNGAVNPNGIDTTYQFEYGKTTSYGSKAPAAPKSIGSGTSTMAVSETITGLQPGTTYHFRIVATTSSQGTFYSADEAFTTLASPRWTVNGKSLAAGQARPFTAASTTEVALKLSNGITLSSPTGECTESGEIEGSAPTAPGTKKNVVLTCQKVKVIETSSGKEIPNCTVKSAGAEVGTIKTNSLKSTLVWLNETGAAAGDLVEPTSGTNWATIEILGAACAAAGKSNLIQAAIGEVLPVAEEAKTSELNLPSTAILNYYSNNSSRVNQTISQLKYGPATATLAGKFDFSLNSNEPVGVASSPGPAPRWTVNGKSLAAGQVRPFTAASTTEVALKLSNGITLSSPTGECTESGEIEGSAPTAPGTKKNVVLTCQKVKVIETSSGKEIPNCTVKSAGAEVGTIKTNSLKSTLVWLNETGAAAGDLVEPTSGTNWATIEILGAACAAAGKSNLIQAAIGEVLPVAEEAKTSELNLPSTAILNYYSNNSSRVNQTISQLKYGPATATLAGKFDFSLNSNEPVGVASSPGPAPRWTVNGKSLAAGQVRPFTAASTTEVALKLSNGITLSSPTGECTESGEIEGSAAGTPGTKKNVVLTCQKVKVIETSSGKEIPNCTVKSAGSEVGTLKTNSLKSTLVWLNETGAAAGDLIEPTSGTNWATIEILGAACAAAGKSNLIQAAISEVLPVAEEAKTSELNLPSTAILNYYNNETSRAKQTIPQLKYGPATATLAGKFDFSLNSKEPVGAPSGW
jgi:sugar lactone lactonase YvrE